MKSLLKRLVVPRNAEDRIGLLIIGFFVILCAGWQLPRIPENRARARHNAVTTDLTALKGALQAYRADHAAFPPATFLRDRVRDLEELQEAGGDELTTFDPRFFNPEQREVCSSDSSRPYAYWSDQKRWVLLSPGPNWTYEVQDLARLAVDPKAMTNFAYDPTNGTVSNGDIWLIG